MLDSTKPVVDPGATSIATLLEAGERQLTKTSPSARLDAEVLLCHCLNKPRSFLRTWPDHRPDSEQTNEFRQMLALRSQGHPVAYLLGLREFWSREFIVTPDVLIPRPDSELLVELSLVWLARDRAAKILDLGTGSGILAITLAAERPLSTVLACDNSSPALAVAERNAERLAVDNVRFVVSDWFAQVTERDFDLILSNPPYIAAEDPHLQQGDVRFEPRSALVSQKQGLSDIESIAEQAGRHLKPGGRLLVEHGYEQAAPVQAIFDNHGYRAVATHRDLAGNPRVTSGLWQPL
ncbi:peptide chain release factor N(5)-glutamine methyltransferase [Methylomonas sp. CM2]|uniref:peptide chain release factor N(5)-glutamine methyltransferase n=1 Tax=Methylomonas sp. CM2 TaxID=3417647 RepID=UPI003CE6BD39